MNFEHDPVIIAGHFSVTGGAIAANSRYGNGYTVAYTAAGRFTVTTDDPYNHLVACHAFFASATPTDRFCTADVPTGGAGAAVAVEINLWDVSGAAVTDPAAATDEVHFILYLSNSALDRQAW